MFCPQFETALEPVRYFRSKFFSSSPFSPKTLSYPLSCCSWKFFPWGTQCDRRGRTSDAPTAIESVGKGGNYILSRSRALAVFTSRWVCSFFTWYKSIFAWIIRVRTTREGGYCLLLLCVLREGETETEKRNAWATTMPATLLCVNRKKKYLVVVRQSAVRTKEVTQKYCWWVPLEEVTRICVPTVPSQIFQDFNGEADLDFGSMSDDNKPDRSQKHQVWSNLLSNSIKRQQLVPFDVTQNELSRSLFLILVGWIFVGATVFWGVAPFYLLVFSIRQKCGSSSSSKP